MFAYGAYHAKQGVEVAGGDKYIVFLGKHAGKVVFGACLAKAAGYSYYNKVFVALNDTLGIVVVVAVYGFFNGGVDKVCKQHDEIGQ